MVIKSPAFAAAAFLLAAASASATHATESIGRYGKHQFPHRTAQGLELANEFQLIQPQLIRDMREAYRTGVASGSYDITAVSPLLIDNDDVVTVSYSSSSPASSDWIGAYSPPPADSSALLTTVPVKYGYCDEDNNYLSSSGSSSGTGALTFNLTNLRADVAFYYFTGGTSKPVLVAQASDDLTVSFRNVNQPLRPRVVATGDIDTLNLVWSSATSSTPQLRWGERSGKYSYSVNASTSSIAQSDLCGAPAATTGWRDLGLLHTAAFEGMKEFAGRSIFYTFGDLSTDDFSSEFELHVPPLPGQVQGKEVDGIRPTRAVLFDDLGRGSSDMTYTWNEYGRPSLYTLEAVGAEVAAGNVDVIYHGGDISYATGYLAVWDFWLDMISPAAASTLYLSTVGNHESDWYDSASYFSNGDSGGECGVATTRLLPQPAPAETNAPWWSYEVGMFHFIGMSTEQDFTVGSEQYNWLLGDLQGIDRSITPWVIFGGHRAMYLNSDYDEGVSSDGQVMTDLIDNIEPLLYEYKVNLGFYGHNHVVQRHTAVLNRTVVQASTAVTDADGNTVHWHEDPQATVHMVVGTGGAGFTVNYVEPYPAWNEMVMYEWGYARIIAVNESFLDWQWVEAQSGEVMDRMVITQADPLAPFDASKQLPHYRRIGKA